jgi:hypothetical protein
MFNNYSLEPEFKMDYNPKKGFMKSFDKTRVYNYEYVVADNKGI